MKTITFKQFAAAKEGTGGLDKILEPSSRKFFPFKYFTNFQLHNGKKKIAPLHCGTCGCDLSESGNGSYYTGYVVFLDNKTIAMACSNECMPENTWDYHDQIYGNRYPIVLPEQLKESPDHKAVFDCFISGHHQYELASYPDGITREFFKEELSYEGGGNWMNFKHHYVAEKFKYQFGNKKPVTITETRVLNCINEIISYNTPMQKKFRAWNERHNKKKS